MATQKRDAGTVEVVNPALSMKHPLTARAEKRFVEIGDGALKNAIALYKVKMIAGLYVNRENFVLTVRLLSSNFISLCGYENSEAEEIPEKVYKMYLKNECKVEEYTWMLFTDIAIGLLQTLYEKTPQCFPEDPMQMLSRAISGISQMVVLPKALPDNLKQAFEKVNGTEVMSVMKENMRGVNFGDLGRVLAHIYTAAAARTILMSTFEMMLGVNLKGSEKFTSLSPEDKEVARKSLEIGLLRKECGHQSNLRQLQGAMLEFGIHQTAEEMANLTPYDLLGLLVCLGQIEGCKKKIDFNGAMDAFGQNDPAYSLFVKAAEALNCSGNTVAIYTDAARNANLLYSQRDIDDTLALMFLRWFCEVYRVDKSKFFVVVCDVPDKASPEAVQDAFPGVKMEFDNEDCDMRFGEAIRAQHALIIGPVHEKTLLMIWKAAVTIAAVSPGSGVNGAHSGSTWQRLVAGECDEDVNY